MPEYKVNAFKVVATVVDIPKGFCYHGFKVGDKVVLERGNVSGIKCSYAFNAIYPFMFAMRYGVRFPWLKDLDADFVILQCPDPDVGVLFEVKKGDVEEYSVEDIRGVSIGKSQKKA